MSNAATLIAAAGIGYAVTRKPGAEEPPRQTGAGGAIAAWKKRLQSNAPSPSGVYNSEVYRDRRENTPGWTGIPKEQADKQLAKMRKALDEADDKARAAICKEMKKQFPNNGQVQAIDCDASSTEQIVNAAIAVAGTAAGTALCGPACGAAGGIIAGLFAEKYGGDIAEWLDDSWDSVEEFGEDAIDWIGESIDDII